MSQYPLLHPTNITKGKFSYNRTNFVISVSSVEYSHHNTYQKANGAFNDHGWVSSNVPPPIG